MTTVSKSETHPTSLAAPAEVFPLSNRFHWVLTLLSAWFTIGLFVDGWAHNHGRVDESFFTPWHGIFYSGFIAVAGVLLLQVVRNRQKGLPLIPAGYRYTLIGAAIFAAGGVGDLVWHELFGIEEDVEALLSPTHLLLVVGMVLVTSGPFQAASNLQNTGRGWKKLTPMLLSISFALSVITFITQFAHPQVSTWATHPLGETFLSEDIFLMKADGSAQTRLTNSPDTYDTQPAGTPDGEKIVFSAETEDGSELFVINMDGSGRKQLTDTNVNAWNASWSVARNQVVFTSEMDGNYEIYKVNADGQDLTRLTNDPGTDWWPAWSPDGTQIAFGRNKDDNFDIFVMNADGTGLRNLTAHSDGDWDPAWSPDGTQIAFSSDREGHEQIFVMNADGTDVHQITGGEHYNWGPTWSPTGDRIAFVSDATGDQEIYTIHPDGTGMTNITQNPALNEGWPSWTVDGSQILYRANGGGDLGDELSQSLGVASILLQTIFLVGVSLILLRRWQLPFGALTLVFTLNAVGMSFMRDEFRLIPAALLMGLIADLVVIRWGPFQEKEGRLRLFAFLVGAVYYTLYFATLFITDTVSWSIHFWAGSIVMAGLVGFLLSYFFTFPYVGRPLEIKGK